MGVVENCKVNDCVKRELLRDMDELRAENERLKDRIDEHHKMFEPMRAENERLRAELDGHARDNEIIKVMRAENERLRAALTEMGDKALEDYYTRNPSVAPFGSD